MRRSNRWPVLCRASNNWSEAASGQRKPRVQGARLVADGAERRLVLRGGERLGDPAGDGDHLLFLHAAGGDGGSADADAARFERGGGVERDAVLVHGDAGLVERFLGDLAVEALRAEVDEHEVVVGAAGDDAEPVAGERGGERRGVGDDLPLILVEPRLERFVEADRLGGDDVHERAALDAGKDHGIDLLRELLPAQDDAAARAAQATCAWSR